MPDTVSLPSTPDDPFYKAVLRGIGAPVSGNTLAAFYAWRQAEGGKAAYNPFNTSWKKPGSTTYNTHGVQSYASPADGVDATVKTLLGSKYTGIVTALRGDKAPGEIVTAITASPWGTKQILVDVLGMFGRGKVVVAPIATVPGAPAISTLEPVAAKPQKHSHPRPPARKATNWPLWIGLGGAAVLLLVAGLTTVSIIRGSKPASRMPAASAFKANRRRRRR